MDMSGMPEFPGGEAPFVEMLRSHTPFVPRRPAGLTAGPEETDAGAGVRLVNAFPDPEHLLDTAIFHTERFLREAGMAGKALPLLLCQAPGMSRESYRITVMPEEIRLDAGDTEGIRRGLYHLCDLLSVSPCLKQSVIRRTPWLKNRISRCFFGPIKRPPFNIDELMNDVDYYPEEYLDKLASEGVNGIWLTITFREICDASLRPACPDAARRREKLRKTVERCRRYGIKVWVFCIEPASWSAPDAPAADNPLPAGGKKMAGPKKWPEDARRSFCPDSEVSRRFLYESVNSLFGSVPHLGGMIVVSLGERITSCLSTASELADSRPVCMDRCGLTPGEILGKVLTPLRDGIRDASPEAELLTFLYIPQIQPAAEWVFTLPGGVPQDVGILFNFESGITELQCGRPRVGGDYWLSAAGPSERFRRMALGRRGNFGAKLQVGCSHEVATVPYVPVPGILYRKYKAMRELGVENVLQCWYFGNFPGVMNRAAGKLAFEDFSGTEESFLQKLAAPEWGDDAPVIVKSWQHFARGYAEYPLDIMFQYYGPMHDGPVWPLHLRYRGSILPRSWKPEDFPAGDALSDCMHHFDLHELCRQAALMSEEWHRGVELMEQLSSAGRELLFTPAQALDILFGSGRNILEFYALRNALMDSPPDAGVLLDRIGELIAEEIRHSEKLAELCEKDGRLGYHSEAEVYKYFPAKLRWRAEVLRQLLAEDFAEAQKLLRTGGDLAGFLKNTPEFRRPGVRYEEGAFSWVIRYDAREIRIECAFRDPDFNSRAYFHAADFKLERPALFSEFADARCTGDNRTADGWRHTFVIPRERLHFASEFRFGLDLEFMTEEGRPGKRIFCGQRPGNEVPPDYRLHLGWFRAEKLIAVRLEP